MSNTINVVSFEAHENCDCAEDITPPEIDEWVEELHHAVDRFQYGHEALATLSNMLGGHPVPADACDTLSTAIHALLRAEFRVALARAYANGVAYGEESA